MTWQLALGNFFFYAVKWFTRWTFINGEMHRLRTSNEGMNQRYLKNWADVADKICFEISAVQLRLFPLRASVVRDYVLLFDTLLKANVEY